MSTILIGYFCENRVRNWLNVSSDGSRSLSNSATPGVVLAHTAASSASNRSTACRYSAEVMVPEVLAYCFNSHLSFFNHQVADCPFFPENDSHREKSGLFPLALTAMTLEGVSMAGIGSGDSGNSVGKNSSRGGMSSGLNDNSQATDSSRAEIDDNAVGVVWVEVLEEKGGNSEINSSLYSVTLLAELSGSAV